jgi:hypothetical protein
MTETVTFCPFCGTRLATGAAFCQSCGKQISRAGATGVQPAITKESKTFTALEWFKARSLKGKIFYIWWATINLFGFVQIFALFAPDDTLQTGCGAKFTMRSFLDGTYESCGPTQSEQVSSRFVALLFQNAILLAFFLAYKRYRTLPIKPIFATGFAMAVGIGVSLFNNAYIATQTEYPGDALPSIIAGIVVLLIGSSPALFSKRNKNT